MSGARDLNELRTYTLSKVRAVSANVERMASSGVRSGGGVRCSGQQQNAGVDAPSVHVRGGLAGGDLVDQGTAGQLGR